MPVSKNWYCLSTVPKESPYRTRISLLPYIHHRPPILKGIQPHSQNHCPTHREAKWHPRAFQSKVLRLQSPVPIFTRKESPKETMFFAPRVYTRQPSPRPCITHLHQATFWQACPTAFRGQGDSTYHTLHSPTCRLLCSWSALPRGYLHTRPAPQHW